MKDFLLLPKGFLKRATDKCVTLLYPSRCPVCDRPVWPASERICLSCLKTLKPVNNSFCEKCGKKMGEGSGLCSDCGRIKHVFARNRGAFEYGSLSKAMYRYKYLGRREYADIFAKLTYSQLKDYVYLSGADIIAAVPVSKKKLLKRGYNQAGELAKGISDLSGIPYFEGALLRVRDTAPMKLLSPSERQKNLKNAFISNANVVKSKRVLLVDDIYTTGSTMDACSRALFDAGAENVFCMTVASGTGV
ncbi:MAG: ComF family protein [Lachnospiraceae bacterium]|nr:ComF family protein [Lachnospiraceae bacterium]